MKKEIIESEKRMIISNIHTLTKRLNFILEYMYEKNLNIFDKEIFVNLIIEIAQNIEIETKNYTYLI